MQTPAEAAAGEARAGADELLEACRAGDVERFLAALEALLKRGGFGTARQELSRASVDAGPAGAFGHFALSCLVACGLPKQAQAAALLAELGPGCQALYDTGEPSGGRPCLGATGEEAVRQLVGTSNGLKLAVTVLQSWSVSDVESLQAETRQALSEAVLREARSGLPPAAAKALTTFPSLLEPVDQREVLDAVDDGSRDDMALKLAQSLGRECQLHFVERRQVLKRLRAAARGVEAFGLQSEFPDVDLAWRTQALAGALGSGRHEAAVGLSCEEPRLHEACVLGLLENNPELAVELAGAWGVALPPQAAAEAERAWQRHRSDYLCQPEGLQVHIVAAESDVLNMQTALLDSLGVGLDSESSMASVPCLLQLSTTAAAFLVDLQALGGSAALAAALQSVMSATGVVKVGFDVRADLRHIAKSFPALASCSTAANLVDVRDLAASAISREKGTSLKQASQGLGLSALAEKYLGRPLNKAMRVSDWRRRPLSAAQVEYAALDAWVPLQVHGHLTAATHASALAT